MELQVDEVTARHVTAQGWQVLVVLVCVLAGWALILGWLIACTIAGCNGEPEGALAYNIKHGIYGDEMAEFSDHDELERMEK